MPASRQGIPTWVLVLILIAVFVVIWVMVFSFLRERLPVAEEQVGEQTLPTNDRQNVDPDPTAVTSTFTSDWLAGRIATPDTVVETLPFIDSLAADIETSYVTKAGSAGAIYLDNVQDYFYGSPLNVGSLPVDRSFNNCFRPEYCLDLYRESPMHMIHYVYRPYEGAFYGGDHEIGEAVISGEVIRGLLASNFGISDTDQFDLSIYPNYDPSTDNFIYRGDYGEGGGDCFSWQVSEVKIHEDDTGVATAYIADLRTADNACGLPVTQARNYLLTRTEGGREFYVANFIRPL